MSQVIEALPLVPPVWNAQTLYAAGYCVRWNFQLWLSLVANQNKQPDTNCKITNPNCTDPTWVTVRGKDGQAATITVNSVTTAPYGTPASVGNSGTVSEAKLDYVIPAGQPGNDGAAATLALGTVTPKFDSATPSVTQKGTAQARIFDMTLPAVGYVFIQDIPAIAAIEINTDKSMVFTFPTAFPGTNYVYTVQFMNATGLVNMFTWSVTSATATALTIKIRSTIAVLAGAAKIWVTVQYKNT